MSMTHRSGARLREFLVLLTMAGALAPATAAATPQSQSGGGNVRTRCADCATTREAERTADRVRRERLLVKLDSLRFEFEHGRLNDAERERLSKEMSLAVLALQESLGHVRERSLEAAHAAAAAREAWPATPSVAVAFQTGRRRGYLGVTFDGPSIDQLRDNERIIRFYQYPKIALVEPGSPAEGAGIRQGDTLLALNGTDVVAREISLTKMLVPRELLAVRVRRDGNAKDLRVTVGEAPEYVMRRTTAPMAIAMPPQEPMGEMRPRTPTPVRAPTPPSMLAPGVGAVWVYNDGIGGAKVETVTEGLGKALGVKTGVLVVRAGSGTLAHESGLRDGDVILRAAGMEIGTVRELRNVLVNSGDEAGVKLLIVREKKKREVTLRW